jgi:outer membrane receptor protein involved in Fe transport
METVFSFFVGLLLTIQSFAQVKGVVVDGDTGDPLFGATVALTNGTGTTTDLDGVFELSNANSGDLLTISYIGYTTREIDAEDGMYIELRTVGYSLKGVVVTTNVVDIAKIRETPVASSTIPTRVISQTIGNQEFPEVMNRTPGVYATKQGGGYGDSRISLRGFDQRNTSFLINGQPVNDMENGWVYWSNWQGLTDVASAIQIQRGLGASRLAVPSVGGTVSIFTKAAERERGGSILQMIGNDGYRKTGASFSTGKSESGWASSFLLSQWQGDGYVYNTSGEGWTYFAAIGYAPDESNHALNLSVLGAGQWHHQRDVWVSIRDYDYFGEDGIDQRWNSNGGTLNGEEYNMRRNFYNKPLATFNWDWKIADNVELATSLYASAGRGGGTGPRGRNYDVLPFQQDLYTFMVERGVTDFRNPDGTVNFDAVVADNRAGASPYTGTIGGFAGSLIGANGFRDDGVFRSGMVRRASMNSHDWVGAISNLEIESGNFRYSIGVDLRNYKGYHYRVLNDLLGFDAYYSTGNKNSAGQIIETTVNASPFQNTGIRGPKIDYFNVGYVGWQGVNGLIEYKKNETITAVIQAGLSNQSYQREDFFDQPGLPLSDKKNVSGGYLKGGVNYNISEQSNVFANAGLISRQPLFDAVFPNFANVVNDDLQNEEIRSLELGYGLTGRDFRLNVNAYSTSWGNRFISRSLTNAQGQDGTAQFRDVDVLHSGIEAEVSYSPFSSLDLTGMVSIGDWRYTKDFEAALFDDTQTQIGTGTLYTDGAKVGDAAQFTSFFGLDWSPVSFLNFDLGYRFVDGLYADYSITDSDFLTPDNDGALKLPSYGLADLGTTLRFNIFGDVATFRLNVNNLFDTVYIAESNSNIHATDASTTWNGIDTQNYVWFGFGRTWNASLKYNF